MKVKELIAELNRLDGNADVIMSSDAEGNSFHSVDCAEKTGFTVIVWPAHDYVELE